jgi:hypothetical protein
MIDLQDKIERRPDRGPERYAAMSDEKLRRYSQRVGFTNKEIDLFRECNHRIRHIDRLSDAAPLYSIVAEVVEARHCNSGHHIGQRLVLDVDGNLITKLCPSRICVYLASQLTIPVALINERLSEKLAPNDFHFMRYVRCPDAGVECLGYGEVKLYASAAIWNQNLIIEMACS